MKTFAVITLGCKVNYYDSQTVVKLLTDAKYKLVDFDKLADIYIINTCSVTNLSDRKSRQMLHRARKKNSAALIIAMGCYAQTAADDLINSKAADLVVGTNNRKDILRLIKNYKTAHTSKKLLDVRNENIFEEMDTSNKNERVRAFIKIQDGCNEFCSYCIIPYARGKSRSRNFFKIYEQTENLCANGFKEIVLTGINISVYGKDFDSDINLAYIIEKLHGIKNLERIRLSSVEPNLINDKFIAQIKNFPKLCPHFHISLQSGSDKILHAMNRKYTAKLFYDATKKLKNTFKNVSLTTDIIVGFPGEMDEDFTDTYNFVKQIGFSKIHVFPFSPRKNTRAYNFSDKVADSIKKMRAAKLISLSNELSQQYIEKFIGKNLSILIEKKINDKFIGHTDNYIKVIAESKQDLINQIVNINISDVDNNFAVGKIID